MKIKANLSKVEVEVEAELGNMKKKKILNLEDIGNWQYTKSRKIGRQV